MPEPPSPADPDVDLHVATQRAELRRGRASLLATVAAGGALGAGARYGATLLWPAGSGAFPWAVFGVNALGCALIGVFMAVHDELPAPHRLLRPFVGVGVLGGFTTFSTYAEDVRTLFVDGPPLGAVAYLAATPLLALLVVAAAATTTRAALARRRRQRTHRSDPDTTRGTREESE